MILCLLLFAGALHAQTVPQTVPQTVQGTALNSVTHKPVAGATVQLIGLSEEADDSDIDVYRTQSNSAGRFRFDRVTPGHYRIVADAQGFTRTGARTTRVTVDTSPRDQEIVVPMIPAAVISGRVADPDGDPIPYVSVDALQYTYQGGKKGLRSVASVLTNDRGEYRLFSLLPGRYYVRATLRSGRDTAYAPLFFPGSRDVAQATPLDAAPGAELRSIDLMLRPEKLHSIGGRVVDGQTGQPVANAYVIARLNGDTFSNGGPQVEDSFNIRNLPPGRYVLSAQEFHGGAPQTARLMVDLGEADLTGVVLTLNPGVNLSGAILDFPKDAQPIQLSLQSDPPSYDTVTTAVTPKGAFAFLNVRPDIYHLLWTFPKGFYVKSIKLGDRLLPDDRIDLTGALAPLTIQLASDGGRVQGVVRNSAGEPVPGAVVTMTADPSYDFWSATCDNAGRFEIRDIAPGDYRLLAFDDAPQGAPQDPDFRKPYEKTAARLQVLPSTQQTLNLIAIP